MNLKNELKQMKETDMQRHSDVVSEVKLLLEGDAQQDMQIMRHLAVESSIMRAEDSLGRKINLENLERDYGEIYTIDQIKTLCIKYQLRFLSSRIYKGTLPLETISKLKQFSKETNTGIDEHSLRTKFFIIAPVEEFNVTHLSERAEKERIRRELDPVLFYKIDNEHYRMIHKWGNDFSPMRRIKGILFKSENNHNYIMSSFVISIGLILFSSIIYGNNRLFNSPLSFIISVVLCILVIILTIYLTILQQYKNVNWWTENNWDNTNKMKQ